MRMDGTNTVRNLPVPTVQRAAAADNGAGRTSNGAEEVPQAFPESLCGNFAEALMRGAIPPGGRLGGSLAYEVQRLAQLGNGGPPPAGLLPAALIAYREGLDRSAVVLHPAGARFRLPLSV